MQTGEMLMAVWDDFITERGGQVFARAGYTARACST